MPSDLMGDNATITRVAAPPAVLTKTVAKSEIIRGERVELHDHGHQPAQRPLRHHRHHATGLQLVTGSATVNGIAALLPTSGNVLTFANPSRPTR